MQVRIRAALPCAIAALMILLCLLSTAISLALVYRARHGAILWDEWDTIPLFGRLRQGTATFHDFIRQHNEHRILFPRLVFALDLALTDARNTVNHASILVCQALHVLLFWRMIFIGTQDRVVRWSLAAMVTLLLFSLVQYENFIWGFQIQFVGVFLFFTLAAWLLSGAQSGEGVSHGNSWFRVALGFFFGAGAALVMSNGVAALLCIGLAFLTARRFNCRTLAILLVGLALIVVYAATFTPNPGHTPLGFSLRNPLIFIHYVGVYLGSIFAPLGLKAASLAGFIGLVLLGGAALGLFTGRIARNRVNLTLVAILGFVALTAAMTAMGRASFGVGQAASSRYATPSAVFWAAAVTLVALWLLDRPRERPARAQPALWLLLGITFLTVATTALVQRAYRDQSRFRVVEMARASDAILSEVYDTSALKVLFPDVELIKRDRIPILKAHRLNMFSDPQLLPLGAQVSEARLADDPARCVGAIDAIEPVVEIPGAFQVRGWAWNRTTQRPPERLFVLSADRRVIGYGSSGGPRADMPAKAAGVTNLWIGWTAFAREPGGQLNVYGLLADGTLCRVGGRQAP
jgi:hypothetical protein